MGVKVHVFYFFAISKSLNMLTAVFLTVFDTCRKQTLLVFETTKKALESQDPFFPAAPETPSKSIHFLATCTVYLFPSQLYIQLLRVHRL